MEQLMRTIWTTRKGPGSLPYVAQDIAEDLNGNLVVVVSMESGTGGDISYKMKSTNDGGCVLLGWTDSYGAGNERIFADSAVTRS